ncbi:type VII secretion protein EsaA [Enterococcus sp. BWR-S5]|uniref:type VII secretion protein EsaA n=1 Tax=Enterococcus sp. BWR-S5 TaxID=2787714 RepID=UPI00192168D0|nr:type VII secretion protein EsaA [Enterococcus sp. BWR-S5]MBL1226905.1 type VII secretion protein EsaA [Enterococcus sp. BWR-S5]
MNNKKLYYILKSVWMVVVLIVALIFMNRDHTDISANKEEEATRLNIALVNEDVGVTRNGRAYSLGVDYVKKIEKDTDHNWFTVTRGIGESGLKNGTYNLLITIPSTFSEKLLELDSSSPEKLQINYKINANGNSTLENESRSVGRSIVSGLNQQLVDMYVVSIIDNLFTAQRNIEKVYTNQTESVGNFQDVLYQPTINFKDYLPALTSQSNSALQSNDLLTSLLSSFSDSTVSLLDSHKDYSTILEELLQQRAEGKLTYEEFLEILLTLDSSILSSETSSLMSTISNLNDYFVQQFSSQEEGQYFQQMAGLTGDFTQSKLDIDTQLAELEALRDKYFEKYEKQFYSAFGYTLNEGDVAPGITLRDVIKKKYEMDPTIPEDQVETEVNNYFDQIENFNDRYIQRMQERLDSLPLRDVTDFADVLPTTTAKANIFNYTNAPYWNKDKNTQGHPLAEINTYLTSINSKIATINDDIKNQNDTHYNPIDWSDPYIGVPQLEFLKDNTEVNIDKDANNNPTYYKSLQEAYTNLDFERQVAVGKRHKIVIDWQIIGKEASIFVNPTIVGTTQKVKLLNSPSAGVSVPELLGSGINENSYQYKVQSSTNGRREIIIPYELPDDYDETEANPKIKVKVMQSRSIIDSDGREDFYELRATQNEEGSVIVQSLTSTSEEVINSSGDYEDIMESEENSESSEDTLEDVPEYSDAPTSDDSIEGGLTAPEAQIEPRAATPQNGYAVTIDYTLDTSAFLSENYQIAKRAYSEEIGKILELYKTVDDELAEFSNYPFITFHTFLDMNLTDVFKTVLNQSFMNTDGDFEKQWKQLQQLKALAESIELKNTEVQTTLVQTQENTTSLNASVAEQMELLNTWQETSQSLTASESLVSAVNAQTDSEVTSVYETLKMILSQSEMVKESSQQNVEQADGVKTIFDSFNNEVKNAQQNSEELSENADQIMEELNTELANNSNFVDAFVKVLNNAYQDGVPNNSLLQFIANPVTGNAEATIQTTEVNQPFTWILIMFTLSLFLAYLFATQPVVRKIKDKFKREQLWFKDNIMETILLSTSAVVVGLILALLSIGELAITKESQIVWIMMVLIFMLIFSLMNHYALKQFHIAGFALSLFLFVSYVFVTNAIGKTKENNPLVGFIRQVNPLSIGEHNLADILSNNALDIVKILLYLLIIAGLVAFNIFIWKPRKKAREVAKK